MAAEYLLKYSSPKIERLKKVGKGTFLRSD